MSRDEKARTHRTRGVLDRAAFCLLLSFLGVVARGQDVNIPKTCTAQPTCTFTPTGGLAWAQGNLNFVFKPIDPRATVYIYIHNLNPTSAHTSQVISVWQSPFSIDLAPSLSKNSSRWVQAQVTQNSIVGATCNDVNALNDTSPGASGLGSCFVVTTMAAQVAIQITGANAQTGSPDNFELSIVQSVSSIGGTQPGSATAAFGDSIVGAAAAPGLLAAAETFSQAYSTVDVIQTTPAANTIVAHLNSNGGPRSLYPDRAIVNCSAACDLILETTNTTGSGCTTATDINLRVNSIPFLNGQALSNASCATPPATTGAINAYTFPAAGSYVIDLRGIIVPGGAANGIAVQMNTAMASGTIKVGWFWYEK